MRYRIFFAAMMLLLFMGCSSPKRMTQTADSNTQEQTSKENDQILILVDGNSVTQAQLEQIDPERVKTITVIKERAKVAQYTNEEYDGVILIELKK